ncbi:MAG: FAD-dependent oxidoreductase [Gammaproteobacteria bacterium]|nr:FAD-dependent oxidoreductase [Gammaproteobacteria bacterium]
MPRQRWVNRGWAFVICGAVVIAFFMFDGLRYLNFETLASHRAQLTALFATHPAAMLGGFFALYVGVTGLSLPGAAVLTLAAGALFGWWWGTLLVSFASTLGATLACAIARYLFRERAARFLGSTLTAINAGLARDGGFYLLSLRLVPAIPFFVINLALGLTTLPLRVFYLVSQLGMFPATVIFVNAGTHLGQIRAARDILSPQVVISLCLLGVLPLLTRALLQWWRRQRTLRRFPKPARFDRNLIVIGAGSAGLVAAYLAAALRAKVTLIERHKMGGDCLNTGCVPSKTLLRAAKQIYQARHADRYGLPPTAITADFATIMAHVQRTIAAVAPHDSVVRYQALGVECLQGEARVMSPYQVAVGDRVLTTRGIIVASGARPALPALPGLDTVPYLTSDTLWELRELPARLVVLGGGPIGCELGQAFARLGSHVTIVQQAARLLPREDPEFSTILAEQFAHEGITVMTNYRACAIETGAGAPMLVCAANNAVNDKLRVPFDRLLLAVGREPNLAGLGLEALGIDTKLKFETDRYLETVFPNVYACGDVAGPYRFTHASSHQAWYATINALFGQFRRFAVDYSVLPWCTFTDPEIAHVGLSEMEAQARQIAYEIHTYDLAELDRAITDGAAHGRVKVLTPPNRDRILGVTIAGERAGDMIAEFALAMRHGLGLNKILGTVHAYPTWMEGNKAIAGVWRRAHQPAFILKLLTGYQRWRRHE